MRFKRKEASIAPWCTHKGTSEINRLKMWQLDTHANATTVFEGKHNTLTSSLDLRHRACRCSATSSVSPLDGFSAASWNSCQCALPMGTYWRLPRISLQPHLVSPCSPLHLPWTDWRSPFLIDGCGVRQIPWHTHRVPKLHLVWNA